jgi:hypothetical protein
MFAAGLESLCSTSVKSGRVPILAAGPGAICEACVVGLPRLRRHRFPAGVRRPDAKTHRKSCSNNSEEHRGKANASA